MIRIALNQIRTIPLKKRKNKITIKQFAKPPEITNTTGDFFDALPKILAAKDFREIVNAIIKAYQNKRPVIVGVGAHVIKCGLSPIIIELIRQGIVTAISLNGAGAIHDFEIALIGATSEDVQKGLKTGTFGMARETGELMNKAINLVLKHHKAGMGQLLAEQLLKIRAPYCSYSIMVAGYQHKIPVTVHVAIGTDIIHMHPSANGSAIGKASYNDFLLFTSVVSNLSGGVYVNLGSAVILPEVFLKAFTIAQNLGARIHNFVTVNIDMMKPYRAIENVVRRPATVGGRGYSIVGHHEILLPLLGQAIINKLYG